VRAQVHQQEARIVKADKQETSSAPRPPGIRLRALLDRSTDPVVSAVIKELIALEDRVCYEEAATAHVIDKLGIDPHELPDPFVPKLHLPPVNGDVPF
jgi:hypothetical protein